MANISSDILKYRDIISKAQGVHQEYTEELESHEKELKLLESEYEDHKKVRVIFQQAALDTQSYLESHLSSIVTNALKSVFFEKNIEFIAKFDAKRNGMECNLYVLDNGEEYDIMDDKGFGLADVVSFSLRVAYVLLDSSSNVLILDEPFRNLDRTRIPYAAKMVKELSTKLKIQFIMVTHIEELADYADNNIKIVMNGKHSEVLQ